MGLEVGANSPIGREAQWWQAIYLPLAVAKALWWQGGAIVPEGALTLTELRVAFAGRRRRVYVPSPVGRFFNIPFTRIRTVREAPFDNFLLCVGGRVSMPSIRGAKLGTLPRASGDGNQIN